MINKTLETRRVWIAVLLAVTLLASCVLPVTAAQGRATTRDGLYVTDDGAYGVYVIENSPGTVGIGKCYLDTLPEDYSIPEDVILNGAKVPVRAFGYLAFENHTEIKTVRIGRHISYYAGDPFRGCTGISKAYEASDPLYGREGWSRLFDELPQYVEKEDTSSDPSIGLPTDYMDIELSTKNLSTTGGKIAVTCTLHEGVNNLTAYLSTTNLVFESMDPIDEGADPSPGSNRTFLRFGVNPEDGHDYGRKRTFYYRAEKEGENVSIEFLTTVLLPAPVDDWVKLNFMTYFIPNNPGRSSYTFNGKYPAYLPVPAEVAPMQEATLEGTNAIRAKAGASPLELSDYLNEAAMVRATEMALAEDLTHTRPDGSDWNTVITGYGNAMAENIVMPGAPPQDQVAPNSVELWRTSSGHYRNMVNGSYRKMGVGYARSASGQWYGCQLFSDFVSGGAGGFPAFVSIDSVILKAPYTPPQSSATPGTPATSEPTTVPTRPATSEPTTVPTGPVTSEPTTVPTSPATSEPTTVPTGPATSEPTTRPTSPATSEPTTVPTGPATSKPTTRPTAAPTSAPTARPSVSASTSRPPYGPSFAPPAGIPEDLADIRLPMGLSWKLSHTSRMFYLTGFSVQDPQTTASLESSLGMPEGMTVRFTDEAGNECASADLIGTGSFMLFTMYDDSIADPYKVQCIVKGDLTGNGKVVLTDLVQMAEACRHPEFLFGARKQAADLNGDGATTLTDLVLECRLMRGVSI